MRDKSVSKTRSANRLTQKGKIEETQKKETEESEKLKRIKNVCLPKGISGKMT